jgi:acetyltransferase-like isoleucine patch superfamily enzyme
VIYPGAFADKTSSLGSCAVLFNNTVLLDSTVGNYTYVQANSAIYNTDIGPFCSIAAGVTSGLGAHPTHMVSTNPVFYDNQQPLPKFFVATRVFTNIFPRTVIGPDVWIGQAVMIRAGVHIGAGAVIGAGSVVTKDIPPYTVAAGVPCRPIRTRFPADICQRLLDSRWWDFDDAKLAELAPLFADPAAFLAAIEGQR